MKNSKCDFCEKAFNCKSYLIIHARIHTGEKLYKSHYCEKLFSQKDDFIVYARIHTRVKPFKCEDCNNAQEAKL